MDKEALKWFTHVVIISGHGGINCIGDEGRRRIRLPSNSWFTTLCNYGEKTSAQGQLLATAVRIGDTGKMARLIGHTGTRAPYEHRISPLKWRVKSKYHRDDGSPVRDAFLKEDASVKRPKASAATLALRGQHQHGRFERDVPFVKIDDDRPYALDAPKRERPERRLLRWRRKALMLDATQLVAYQVYLPSVGVWTETVTSVNLSQIALCFDRRLGGGEHRVLYIWGACRTVLAGNWFSDPLLDEGDAVDVSDLYNGFRGKVIADPVDDDWSWPDGARRNEEMEGEFASGTSNQHWAESHKGSPRRGLWEEKYRGILSTDSPYAYAGDEDIWTGPVDPSWKELTLAVLNS